MTRFEIEVEVSVSVSVSVTSIEYELQHELIEDAVNATEDMIFAARTHQHIKQSFLKSWSVSNNHAQSLEKAMLYDNAIKVSAMVLALKIDYANMKMNSVNNPCRAINQW